MGFVNSSLLAWRLVLGHGPVTNGFAIQRSASGSYSEQTLFKINNAGNVDIGTSNPQLLADIRKDVPGVQGPVLKLTNGGSGGGARSEILFFTYYRCGTSPSARIKVADDVNWSGDRYFDTKGVAGDAPLYTRMFIEGKSGYVGLDTTTPQGLLSLKGPLGGRLIRLTTLSDNGEASIVFNTHTAEKDYSNQWVISAGAWYAGEKFMIGNPKSGGPIMTFLHNGKIDIGTTASDELLTVKGTIHASAVIIDLNVPSSPIPDYVFKKGYRLRSLSEVKCYVDAHSHLPEIFSAKEIAKNCINVMNMNLICSRK